MSTARKALDWETMLKLSIDPPLARRMHEESPPRDPRYCTMCGELCALRD